MNALVAKGMVALLGCLCAGTANAAYFPMYSNWPQPGGPASPFELTYSYSNLLDGSLRDAASGAPVSQAALRGAFEAALWDYAEILPITFREIADAGPLPETGEYSPAGVADIRIGHVPDIEGANAYAYFPREGSGLAGDIVFNAGRFGNDWNLALFYGVAQHELGHSLGMGHAVEERPETETGAGQSSAYDGPLFPLHSDMIVALQGVYGAGRGSVVPVPLPASLILLPSGLTLLAKIAGRRGGRRRAQTFNPRVPASQRSLDGASPAILWCSPRITLSDTRKRTKMALKLTLSRLGFCIDRVIQHPRSSQCIDLGQCHGFGEFEAT